MDLIINLDKPAGITSQEASSRIKRITKARRAGHTGTLDPMATGVLLVCINRATRLASYFSLLDKEYEAVMKLGETTDTQDSTGRVLNRTEDFDIRREEIEGVINSFKGKILQRPPMFSAIKYKGRALYRYAREGKEIERGYREVTLHDIRLLDVTLPFVRFVVVCSKGTYIRTLCNDIGEKLGVGAHLYNLKRRAIGPFHIKDSITFDELECMCKMGCKGKGIYEMGDALSFMPELIVSDKQARDISNGCPLRISDVSPPADDMRLSMGIRIKSRDGRLLAIGSLFEAKGLIKMDVVFGA